MNSAEFAALQSQIGFAVQNAGASCAGGAPVMAVLSTENDDGSFETASIY